MNHMDKVAADGCHLKTKKTTPTGAVFDMYPQYWTPGIGGIAI